MMAEESLNRLGSASIGEDWRVTVNDRVSDRYNPARLETVEGTNGPPGRRGHSKLDSPDYITARP